VPAQVKAGLLDLIEQATAAGWRFARACQALGLGRVRAHRWAARRAHGDDLADARPGGGSVHALLPEEEEAIVQLAREWGEVDRSHRKLAHRGSYLQRVWVSASSVRRVLVARGIRLRRPPRPERAPRPQLSLDSYGPNEVWIWDCTHFTRAKRAVLAIVDVVSRKWIELLVSAEETSTQVQVVFTAALEAEGLMERIAARLDGTGALDLSIDDPDRPILLAMSDNGPQMTSGSTREFMALCAIVQQFERPGCPTDQAWVESFFGHIKGEHPHLEQIREPDVLRAELERIREHYNGVRLHAGIGYVTPNDEHEGRGPAIRKARQQGLDWARRKRIAYHRKQRQRGGNEDPKEMG
jgi:putative transposase